jgi:uncharacterized small protein (DUF1192 family)
MDENATKPKDEPYVLGMPLEAMSLEALHAYLKAMDEESKRVLAEIDARGEVRAAAEALFS